MDLVSVVIPAYNSAAFLPRTLNSVLEQTYHNFEVLVVDDGSTDDTQGVVQSYAKDSRICYIYQKNGGAPSAKNAGAQMAKGEFVLFLDADDLLSRDAIEKMYKAFSQSQAAWGNIGVLKLDGEKKILRHATTPEGDMVMAILDDDFVTRCPFYPRSEFLGIGMFDTNFPIREDWDINIRMIRAGKPYVVIDEPLYLYSRIEGSLTTGNRRKVLRFTEKLLLKHHKVMADAGNAQVAKIYAKNMWQLAREYFYELKEYRESMRCAAESFRYDMKLSRLWHPIVNRIDVGLGRRQT
jgi:glycosyltransferase involved in cell wall biosynthesis